MDTYGYIYTPDYFHRNYNGYVRSKIHLTESRLERRIDELHCKLSAKKPDVFVSHKSDDQKAAEEVAIQIAKCGLTAYLDIWDPEVDGDGPELVGYITDVIECCKSLIAVVSHKTVESWWVPLEIGIAITKDLHLGTYLILTDLYTKEDFPSYLWKWPVLTSMDKLENWCKEHKKGTSPQVFYESLKQKHPKMFEQYEKNRQYI